MTTTAQYVIQRCVETLSDVGSVRWTIGALARYFNDGQREIVIYRPDATTTAYTLALAVGARQALPANGVKLLDILQNTSSKKAVRLITRSQLDNMNRSWRAAANTSTVGDVTEYTFDPRDPTAFYVYPPATVSSSVDILYSVLPTDITAPASGTYADITGNMSVRDIFSNALQDYILYRAFSMDAEQAGNQARAAACYAAFANALGVEAKATMTASPGGAVAEDATSAAK